jgi:antitoxin ParD1/3/4
MTMNVSVGERWEGFVDEVVRAGRYNSASEVVREGLRLVEEREEKLKWLRDKVNASIAHGGSYSSEEVLAHVMHTAGTPRSISP